MTASSVSGVNGIPDNSRLLPIENLKSEHVNSNCPIHTATPDTTQFCRVGLWCGSVNWVCSTARQVRSVSGLCRSASVVRLSNSDAERTCPAVNSHRLTQHKQHCLVVSGGRCELGVHYRSGVRPFLRHSVRLSVCLSCTQSDLPQDSTDQHMPCCARADTFVMSCLLRSTCTLWVQKQDTELWPITFPNVNRFSKFFRWQTQW